MEEQDDREPLVSAKDEEQEDAKPIQAGEGERRRRAQRTDARVDYEVRAVDDGQETTRASRRSRSTNPSPKPRKRVKQESKEEQDEADLLSEDESDGKMEDFPDLVEAMGDVNRPAELPADANLLRPASLSNFDVVDENTSELSGLGMFARRDLGGNEQNTTDKTQKRIDKWGTMRKCWRSSRNLGCRGPGKAFLVSTTPHPISHQSRQGRFSVFLRLRDAAKDVECWKAYAVYRYNWCGLAKEGEFDRLTEKEKDQVIDVFCSYLRGGKNKFVEWLFREVKVQLNPDDPTLSSLWSTRKTKTVSWQVRRRQQRLALREALSQNNVFPQGWAIMVYDGPLPADELDFIKRRRAVRQAGGDPRSIRE